MPTNSKEYSQEYYKKNGEKMREYMKLKTKCEICGSVVCKALIKRHMRAIKCKSFGENLKALKDMTH